MRKIFFDLRICDRFSRATTWTWHDQTDHLHPLGREVRRRLRQPPLWHGLRATSRRPFAFYCITDRVDGLRPEIVPIPLPDLDCEMPKTRQGIWGKSRLWRADLGGLSGPVLFMDLDVVVTGNLDAFFEHGNPRRRHPHPQPEHAFRAARADLALTRFPVRALTAPARRIFSPIRKTTAETYVFEQRFVTRRTPGGVSFWPRGWVATFRWHCVRAFPLNYVLPPKLSRDARVVIFSGRVEPARRHCRSPNGAIPWCEGRGRMCGPVCGATAGGASHATCAAYLKPAEWVRDAWRE